MALRSLPSTIWHYWRIVPSAWRSGLFRSLDRPSAARHPLKPGGFCLPTCCWPPSRGRYSPLLAIVQGLCMAYRAFALTLPISRHTVRRHNPRLSLRRLQSPAMVASSKPFGRLSRRRVVDRPVGPNFFLPASSPASPFGRHPGLAETVERAPPIRRRTLRVPRPLGEFPPFRSILPTPSCGRRLPPVHHSLRLHRTFTDSNFVLFTARPSDRQ